MKVYAGAPYGDISGVQACRYSENISSQVISCMMFPDDLMMCKAVCVCAGKVLGMERWSRRMRRRVNVSPQSWWWLGGWSLWSAVGGKGLKEVAASLLAREWERQGSRAESQRGKRGGR